MGNLHHPPPYSQVSVPPLQALIECLPTPVYGLQRSPILAEAAKYRIPLESGSRQHGSRSLAFGWLTSCFVKLPLRANTDAFRHLCHGEYAARLADPDLIAQAAMKPSPRTASRSRMIVCGLLPT